MKSTLLAALIPIILGFAPLLQADDAITKLPKFEVQDSIIAPERELWRYAQTPTFDVITDGSESAAQKVVAHLEAFGGLVDVAFPTFLPASKGKRLTLIVCTRNDRFKKFAVDPLDSVALISDHNRLSAIVVLTSLGDLDAGEYEHLDRVLAIARLATLHPRYPVWFEEGMAQIVSHMKVDGKQIVFNKMRDTVSTQALDAAAATGALSDPETALTELTTTQAVGVTSQQMQAVANGKHQDVKVGQGLDDAQSATLDQDFFTFFNGAPLIALDKVFATARGTVDTTNPANDWAKECWAFTDFCLYGNRYKLREPLTQFIRAMAADPAVDVSTAFKAAFGRPTDEVAASFRGYLGGREIEHLVLPKLPADPEPAVFRDATDGEVARFKGEALLAEGATESARLEYMGAYLRGERDPAFIASFGVFEQSLPLIQDDRAEQLLSAAIATGPGFSRARVALAAVRLQVGEAAPGDHGRLSADQTKHAFAPLLDATPDIVAIPGFYEVLAGIWSHSVLHPDKAQLSLLIQGAKLFPDDVDLIASSSALFTAEGYPDMAKELVKLGVNNAVDDPSRTKLAALSGPATPAQQP